MNRLKPPQVVLVGFLAVIFVGAILLALPNSASTGHSIGLVDAFFTATSATCVTGLIVRDTGKEFSRFGQYVILFLIQIGGLGIMTMSTFFAILLGRKLTLRENIVVKNALDHHSIEGVRSLILYILGITFGIEIIGAILFYRRFGDIYNAVFHSISSFCNAGFSINSSSIIGYRSDALVNIVMMSLIILGGIGFVVLIDIPKIFRWAFRKIFIKNNEDIKNLFSKLSLQAKLAFTVSAALLIIGAVVFLLLENSHTLYNLSFKEKILASFFQSTTARTAGFNTVPIMGLGSPTLFFLIILMFIGASPGSTGGGIKTCTFGVLIAGAWSMIKNKDNISMFKRTIPKPVFRKAVMIAGLSITWIVVTTMILSFVEEKNLLMPNYFLRIFFEVTSAFGTVGLSTGITPLLSTLGKMLIMVTMFIGRIGPLTLALAVAMKEDKVFYKYPTEKVMVG
ncbi:MAG: TrkH family potassium uptake protein [Candidatus Omnitrophota bacterium]